MPDQHLLQSQLGPVMLDVEGLQLDAEDKELLQHPLVGGIILFGRNYADPDQLEKLMRDIRECRQDILVAVDYEGGRVQRFRDGFTLLPPMRRLGELFDSDPDSARQAAEDCGWMIASELRVFDIDLSFAPVLDLDTGKSGVIGDRAFHGKPQVVIELAIAFMRGMASAGMAATGKHYPGHGQVVPDSHVELPIDERSYDELVADIAPFAALIQAGLPSVMMAHILYPAIDNLPASLSHDWVTQRLRGELGFKGTVFTDDLSMGGAAAMGSYVDRAMLALQAGCDMLPVCNHRAGVIEILDRLKIAANPEAGQRLSVLRAKSTNGKAPLTDLAKLTRWQEARARIASLMPA